MRVPFGLTTALALLLALPGRAPAMQGDAPGTTYVSNQTLLDAFGKAGAIARTEGYSVAANRRTGDGTVEIHERETDVFFVIDGSATLVTGGSAVDVKATRPGQFTARDITGGRSYDLKKGDLVVIPAGTPHWFKTVNGFINYVTVKAIRP